MGRQNSCFKINSFSSLCSLLSSTVVFDLFFNSLFSTSPLLFLFFYFYFLFFPLLFCHQVLFYISPVNRLVGALMTVLSLFPGKKRALNFSVITVWLYVPPYKGNKSYENRVMLKCCLKNRVTCRLMCVMWACLLTLFAPSELLLLFN